MMLEVMNISKSFGKKLVLDDVSFTLKKGEITGLVGRNGSGKTTILSILSRIIEADTGRVTIDVKDLFDYPNLIENIAFLPDRFDYFSYNTGRQASEYYEILYPNFDMDFVETEAKKLKLDLNVNIRSLSKGNKNILGLLIILATGAEYIFVDEVLDGMDVLNKEIIMGYLLDATEASRAVLVSTHQLDELQGIADKVLYLSLEGKLESTKERTGGDFQKVQIVVKEALPDDILDQAIIRSHIGRVYMALLPGSERTVIEQLVRSEIVQFDIIPLQLEDYFYWERGKEKDNERL